MQHNMIMSGTCLRIDTGWSEYKVTKIMKITLKPYTNFNFYAM